MIAENRFIILILSFVVVVSCRNFAVDQLLESFETRNPELKTLLSIAENGDSLKEPIRYLLENMANKTYYDGKCNRSILDLESIRSDSLILATCASLEVWRSRTWANQYDKFVFENYILPYRVANEPVEYYWKKECRKKFDLLVNDSSVLESARAINKNIVFRVLNGNSRYVQSYSESKSKLEGNCGDRAVMAAMIMRSVGIPAAVDVIPFRGNVNNGHVMMTVILPDGKNVAFNDSDEAGNDVQVNKTPKVFRHIYNIRKDDILYKHKVAEYIPRFFENFDLVDVTKLHSFHSRDLKVSVPVECSNKIIYLSVFSPYGWQVVDYTKNKKSKTVFSNVGTAAEKDGRYNKICENMGDGIIYLPVAYDKNGNQNAVGYPIIHNVEKDVILKPETDKLQTVVLYRKYPRMDRVKKFAETMVEGVFEASNSAGFDEAEMLGFISEVPSSHYECFNVSDNRRYKYVRYLKSTGIFNLGEFKVYDTDGIQLFGKAMAEPIVKSNFPIENIFDGNPLTYVNMSGFWDMWIGLELAEASQIGRIEYCPRTDDNDICPGDEYELFYWDNTWISLGRKAADNYSIQYDNVPYNALLWLRNHSKGVEERPFTYEDGKQIWW